MGDDQGPKAARDGIHVGDFVMRPTSATSTDSHLDTPDARERDRQHDEDARAAQHSAGDPKAAPDAILPAGEGGDVDASIDAAREAAKGAAPGELPMPILLHDPLTGKVIGSI